MEACERILRGKREIYNDNHNDNNNYNYNYNLNNAVIPSELRRGSNGRRSHYLNAEFLRVFAVCKDDESQLASTQHESTLQGDHR